MGNDIEHKVVEEAIRNFGHDREMCLAFVVGWRFAMQEAAREITAKREIGFTAKWN